ncbi:MAG TPA: hypothetical protein VMW56_19380 [Candidatus Margulisiibacteriota bacterium]|nr:hypothetical protein [Candidatus Margulisiibacteriota bacterium]
MAEPLQACCQKARAALVARLTKGIVSYPVIKDVPCPTCRRIIQIRIYVPPGAASDSL